MDEDIAMEDAIWPWLASDCMADETLECCLSIEEEELDEELNEDIGDWQIKQLLLSPPNQRGYYG